MTQALEVLKKKSKNNGEINWVTSIFMVIFHLGAIAALFFFSWKAFCVAKIVSVYSSHLGTLYPRCVSRR